MIEITIFGRGGQGGVTLAKLIATAFFERGKHVQAFGVYAAERSGAPLQAFVRIDDEEITNHNQIAEPDHLIVLDRTLIGPRMLVGHKPAGWVILNTPQEPSAFADLLGGRNVATIDATSIAVASGLGTRAVPIVNTTMLGAAAKVLGLKDQDVLGALTAVKFGEPNASAARQAFQDVRTAHLDGRPLLPPRPTRSDRIAGVLDDDLGGPPLIQTGSWATHQPQRQQLTPPCNDGCPAGNDVRGFVQAVGKEDYDHALAILLRTSPLPGVCGRVCPAPCMEACNRRLLDGSVNVRDLERYVSDHGRRPETARPWREERVAVVGSGPAGLSGAYHLARLGYPVVLFERDHELGGVLRTGIPTYRLPREVLNDEIRHILQHGVEARTGVSIGRAELLTLSHEFAAVFVATGLQHERALSLGGEEFGVIEQALVFLDDCRKGRRRLDGQHIIVVGGGNSAIDAARSARRLGAKSVRLVYRRTRMEMPAIDEEIDEALEEGVILQELVLPLRFYRDGAGGALTCQRMVLGEADETGRRRPIPDAGEDSQFDLRCDRVLLALGQSTDLSILPEGSEVHEGERLLGLSGGPIFGGGDFATNEGTVTAAIGSGRRAALHIHRTLTGEDLFEPQTQSVAGPEDVTMHLFTRSPRTETMTLDAVERRHTFHEVRLGFPAAPAHRAAVLEAQRCFSCGVCNQCNRCLEYCPEGIVQRQGNEYRFDYSYCKGCGICAAQCPRGVIYMAEL